MTTAITGLAQTLPEPSAEGDVSALKAAPTTTSTLHPANNPAVKLQAVPAPHVAITAKTPGVDPFDFERANRIHVKDGSIFLDGYRVINPRELAPGNEAKLHAKLDLAESVNNPSFYESKDRLAVALNLAQILPVSLEADEGRLRKQIDEHNKRVESGADSKLAKLIEDKEHPFAAVVRDTIEKPAKDPVGVDTLKNGVGIYLLMREKLTQLNYRDTLTSYVSHAKTPDQVLGDLCEKIGVQPLDVRKAALKGGLEGVGQLLGLDATYIGDVKQLMAQAAEKEFSLNLIEHWHLGRQLLKGQPSTFEEKIATGKEARITHTIEAARTRVHQQYEVPDPIKHEEERIAEALNLVEPVQRALMYKLGYEIGYTPEVTADNIAYYPGIYGLHRKAANDLRDTTGTYHIYFSGRGDLKGSMRTLVHEIAHNLWPEQFTAEAVKQIDALGNSDAARFEKLNKLMDEKFPELDKVVRDYHGAKDDAARAAVAAKAKAEFAPYGIAIDEAILPYIQDAHDLQFMVKHVYDTLRIEGKRYAASGYSGNAILREEISRFAELTQVEYRAQPQLLNFVAPGWNQIWQKHYLPHLQRVYDGLEQVAATKNTAVAKVLHKDAAEPVAANDVEPKVVEQPEQSPKVDQRPATPPVVATPQPLPPSEPLPPKAPAMGDACVADGTPQHSIDSASAALEGMMLDERGMAAMNTLSAMGIASR